MLTIFDCDGVLVDSEPIAQRVLERYLRDLDYPWIVTAAEHGRFVGLSLDSVRATLEQETGRALPTDFIAELRRRDIAAFETELRAIPAVAETVSQLSGPRCVASSGSPEKIRNSLTLTGLLDLFDPYLFSVQDPGVAHGKPAPDLFEHAARAMGWAARDCLVIEDSLAGVQAGVAAGMRVFGFTGGGHCPAGHDKVLRAAGAEAVFSQMTALPALIG